METLHNRNTPTCVGKTSSSLKLYPPTQKHPHVRGEDVRLGIGKHGVPETPPRAWGRLSAVVALIAFVRNTPTCVGKTGIDNHQDSNDKKHPHVRGEDLFGQIFKSGAGKHPHVRGEDVFGDSCSLIGVETPPRAWGRHARDHAVRRGHGNTPTCVGKTKVLFRVSLLNQKHPHVRGEDVPASSSKLREGETPPRAWGRPTAWDGCMRKSGNTPTCVGKTLRDYSLFLLSRQNNIETSSFSDTSCSPDNSMSWRFGSPMP